MCLINLKTKKKLIIAGLLILLSGCAPLFYSPRPAVSKSRDFKRPFEETWNCTIEALINAGESLSSTDKGSGLIIVKGYEKGVSESELHDLATNVPYQVDWQSMRTEGTLFIRPVDEKSTRVVCNFKIIAKGIPYENRNESGEIASLKDIWKGHAKHVSTGPLQEYVLESNGAVEQSYFVKIAEALLRLRDAGI